MRPCKSFLFCKNGSSILEQLVLILKHLRFKDGIAWLWHLLANLYIMLTISSCYGSISLTLGLIGRDVGLSTLFHSCGFACQQRVPNLLVLIYKFTGKLYMVFNIEGFFEVAIESWPAWDLNPRPLNSVQTL